MLGPLTEELVQLETGGFEFVACECGLGTEREGARLNDARFKTRCSASGIALKKYVSEGFEAFCHFLGDAGFFLRDEHFPRDGAHAGGERDAELLQAEQGEFDVFLRDSFAQRETTWPLESLRELHGPGGAVGQIVAGEIPHAPVADTGHEIGVFDFASFGFATFGNTDLRLVITKFRMRGECLENERIDGDRGCRADRWRKE